MKDKILTYLQGEFGLLQGVGFSSIFLFANPALILKMKRLGLYILLLAFFLSLVQSRFYAIGFLFAFLCIEPPKVREDKLFWLSVILFFIVISLWFILEAHRQDWWLYAAT